MSEQNTLICLIAFILGFLVSKMFRGDGFSIGCITTNDKPGSRILSSLTNYKPWEIVTNEVDTYFDNQHS